MDYKHYSAMDAGGRWQTVDGYYYNEDKDRFFDPNDKIISKPRRIGVRIWAAYSYLRPWSYIADRWIVANKNAKAGNITTLKTVINTLLGETFEETGETVNPLSLNSRAEGYLSEGTIPNDVLIITVGADVQGGLNARIEMEFVGHGLEGETWSLDYVVLDGAAEHPFVWEHVDEELKRRFAREDGVTLRVAGAFIDSGYLASEVYRFTALRRKRNIFATKGVTKGALCNAGTWQGDKKKRTRAILRTVNVDDAKTIIFNRLRISEPGPGFCHFPESYSDKHFRQLTNEEKIEKRSRGILVGHEWIKRGPNEQLDCRAYALGAFEHLNPHLPRIKMKLEKQAAVLAQKPHEINLEIKPNYTEQAANQKKAKIKGRIRRGFVGSWK